MCNRWNVWQGNCIKIIKYIAWEYVEEPCKGFEGGVVPTALIMRLDFDVLVLVAYKSKSHCYHKCYYFCINK